MIDKFLTSLNENPNWKRIARFMTLFKHAVKSDSEDQQKSKKIVNKYLKPESFTKVIQFALTEFIDIVKRYFKLDQQKLQKNDLKNFQMEITLKSFLYNSFRFAEHTVNTQEDNEQVIIFIVRAIEKLSWLLPPFQVYILFFIYLFFFSHIKLESIQKNNQFITLSMESKYITSCQDYCLHFNKKYIRKFQKYYPRITIKKNNQKHGVKHVTFRNYEPTMLMINCVTEIAGINIDQTYQVMYTSLKNLVDLLNKCSQNKNEDNVRKVYSQETLFLLKLWVKTITTYSNDDQLGELSYPLVQVIQGFLNFQPSVDYYPIQLHFIDMLITISGSIKLKIPVLKELLALMDTADLKKRKLKTSIKPYEFEFGIQLKLKHKQSGSFWSDFTAQVVNRFITYLSLQSKAVTFPEETVFLDKQLRSLQKSMGFDGNKIRLRKLILMLRNHRQLILQARERVDCPIHKIYEIQSQFNRYLKQQNIQNILLKEANKIAKEREELIKQKVLAEKEKDDEKEDSVQQEIEDEREQEYVFDEIRKERELKKQFKQDADEYDQEIEFEGDPEEYQNYLD